MVKHHFLLLFSTTCALLIGIVVGQVGRTEFPAGAQSARQSSPFPMAMRTGGNLYLQTSAEYQAACLQVYRCAGDRLRKIMATQEVAGLRPAVVMDLDETVLDNSAFQTYLYRTGQEYTDELWQDYERNYARDVTLIPGAKQFIDEASALGVSVVFLSNRSEANQASTVSVLKRLKVSGDDVEERLYLKAQEAPSDKTSRRDRIAARYNILLIIGDNLRDFAEDFAAPSVPAHPTPKAVLAAISARKAEVVRSAFHWGTNWFIVPNPVYGEWDKLIKVEPKELMHPTSMAAPSTP